MTGVPGVIDRCGTAVISEEEPWLRSATVCLKLYGKNLLGDQPTDREREEDIETHCSSIRFISGDIVSNSFVLRLARSGLSSRRISSSS